MKPKKIILPSFTLTETCNKSDEKSQTVNIAKSKNSRLTYFIRPVNTIDSIFESNKAYSFNYFPIVLCGDSSPWKEANLYLLDKLNADYSPIMSTYKSIASDLADYKLFLEQELIDFLDFPKMKLLRPTYRYKNSLINKIRSSETAARTAQRKISTVVNFYRWIEDQNSYSIKNPPWVEREKYLSFTDSYGAKQLKKIKTTDLSINTPKSQNPFSKKIKDGGNLIPLDMNEQEAIVKALYKINNIEMTLIHLIALFTGARLQTVLTLRVSTILNISQSNLTEYQIKAGKEELVDSKNDKEMIIYMPSLLVSKLHQYCNSYRAKLRRLKYDGPKDQVYLFLTNRGTPYYDSKVELSKFQEDNRRRHTHNGEGVRQFIQNRLIPQVKNLLKDLSFKFKFHDLRATYGMNLTISQINMVEKLEKTLHEAREYVRCRMGHESHETTDLYLSYSHNLAHINNVQESYEEHIIHLTELILGEDE